MAPQRSSHVHPLSLTQRQCQMLLMLGAPVYLPRPRLWTWVTLHKFSIGLLLTFPWPYCHIVELTPRIHLCDYVCQVVPRDSLSAQRARAQVFLERTMKKKSTSTMSTILWIFIACASKNLDVFELFSGTGKIHAQACWISGIDCYCGCSWPQNCVMSNLWNSMSKLLPSYIEARATCEGVGLKFLAPLCCAFPCANGFPKEPIARPFHFPPNLCIWFVLRVWLVLSDYYDWIRRPSANNIESMPFSQICSWSHTSFCDHGYQEKNMWLWLQKYQYWGRVFSMHFVKCSASKLVGFCLWEFLVHCWFSSA